MKLTGPKTTRETVDIQHKGITPPETRKSLAEKPRQIEAHKARQISSFLFCKSRYLVICINTLFSDQDSRCTKSLSANKIPSSPGSLGPKRDAL